MEFLVEDGTGVAGANSYITDTFLIDYAVATGADIGAGDPKAAAIRGSRGVDAMYGARYPGTRLKGRDQGLGWPRVGGTDAEGNAIPSNAVPVEIRNAAAEAAIREMASAGSLSPDVASGAAVKREWMDGVGGTEYATAEGARAAAPRFPVIDGILAPLIGGTGAGVVRLVRA